MKMKYNLKYVQLAKDYTIMRMRLIDFEAELREELRICDLGIEFCEKCQKIKDILGE